MPAPEDLPWGIELGSPALQADSLPTELSGIGNLFNYAGHLHCFQCFFLIINEEELS